MSAASTTEIYGDILEMGREKMKEGDYMKLATFLKTLHDTTTAKTPEIFVQRTYPHNFVLEYDTLKGKHYELKISEVTRVRYRGPKPDDTYITGMLNGEAFTNIDANTIICRIIRIIGFYGMKNIKRQIDGMDFEEYANFEKYKLDVNTRENPDEPDDVEFCRSWYVRTLIGCDFEMFDE
jgi:hypothetical protein